MSSLAHRLQGGFFICLVSASAGATTYTLQALAPPQTQYTYTDNLLFTPSNELVGQSRLERIGNQFGSTAWRFDGTDLITMGLSGEAYTASNGNTFSFLPVTVYPEDISYFLWPVPQFATDAGVIMGYSPTAEFNSRDDFHSWIHDGAVTRRVGEPDPLLFPYAFTDYQRALELNDSGVVLGYNELRTEPDTIRPAGRYLWRDDGSEMTVLGLQDETHLNAEGVPVAYINPQIPTRHRINAVGSVIGDSGRFRVDGELLPADTGYAGVSAWIYDDASGSSIRLGLTDAAHTRADGQQFSVVGSLNDTGQVVGQSFQYTGTRVSGYSAWRYDGDTTTAVAVPSGEAASLQNNLLYGLNQQGDITLVNATLDSRGSAVSGVPWLIRGDAAVPLGLDDAEHTGASGESLGEPTLLSESGVVAGKQTRYDPDTGMRAGSSAWVYQGTETVEIGFPDDYRFNEVYAINAADQIVGTSSDVSLSEVDPLEFVTDARSNGYLVLGRVQLYPSMQTKMAWFFDGEQTRPIELTGDGFACGDGRISITAFNDGGFVRGTAHYCDATVAGSTRRGLTTAWIYDSGSDQVHELTLDRTSYGQGKTRVLFMAEDGSTVGSYQQFDDQDEATDEHAFLFTPAAGMQDLASVVGAEAMSAAGLTRLVSASAISSDGAIAGQAEANDGRIVAFLLTPEEPPVVEPEPDSESDTSRWAWLRPLLGERLYQIVLAWLSQRDQQ